MSLSSARGYANRARHSGGDEVGENTFWAIEELVKTIRDLEDRIEKLEREVKRLK